MVFLSFRDKKGSPTSIPVYSAVRRNAPKRVVLRIHGLQANHDSSLVSSLKNQNAVLDAYAVACKDPTDQAVVIALKPDWDCAVGEYEGILAIQFFPGEIQEEKDIYVLASDPMPFGQEPANLTETLLWEGATQIKTGEHEYRVLVGEYRSLTLAENAKAAISQKAGAAFQVARFKDNTLIFEKETGRK